MNPARVLLCASLLLISSNLLAQSPACQLPPIKITQARGNFFTEEQEQILGDVIAEQQRQELHIIRDEELAKYLQTLASPIVAQLPTKMHYRFELMDLSEANAVSFPGGRILVSRKLIAQTETEDELAGVLAHELGHSVTHQAAAALSRYMRKVLDIKGVTSSEDIRNRYDELLSNEARKSIRVDEHEEQQVADAVAVEAMIRAGYDPKALGAFYDRFANAKGGKRNFLEEIFGAARPSVERVVALQKAIGALPSGCVVPRTKDPEGFRQWRARVVSYDRDTASPELLSGLISRRKLAPALRPDIEHVRYSRNGKHLLVQDGGSIHVFTREPFQEIFQISAPDAKPAMFSMDGEMISFYDSADEPRIETWSVPQRKRLNVHELHLRFVCEQSALAPDGKTFACLHFSETREAYSVEITLFDASSGEEVYNRPYFLDGYDLWQIIQERKQWLWTSVEMLENTGLISMDFSPDSRYFLAVGKNKVVCVEVGYGFNAVQLPGSIKDAIEHGFVFLAPGRILGRGDKRGTKSRVLQFPSGEVLRKDLEPGRTALFAGGADNYVIVRPIKGYEAGIFDINQNRFVIGSPDKAVDAWQDESAGDQGDGKISRIKIATLTPIAQAELQVGKLGSEEAVISSPDLQWLAISGRSRGAVFSLVSGARRFHIRGFDSAWFDDSNVHVDAPPLENAPRAITSITVATGKAGLSPFPPNEFASQIGPVLMITKRDRSEYYLDDDLQYLSKQARSKFAYEWSSKFEFRDLAGQKTLWTKSYYDEKYWFANAIADSVAFLAKPGFVHQLDFFRLTTGEALGSLKIDTGRRSFKVRDAFASGEFLIVADDQRRVSVYRRDGTRMSHVFGTLPVVAVSKDILAVRSERGQVGIYRLSTGERIDTLQFSQPVLYKQFSSTGERLLVVTADQTAHIFDTSLIGKRVETQTASK